MIIVKINNKEYGLPENAGEILARQYVDFMKQHAKVNLEEEDIYTLTVELAKCLCAYWGIELEDLAEVQVNNETTESYISTLKQIVEHESISGMVAQITKVVLEYQSKTDFQTLSFNYRNHLWVVPHFKANEFTGKVIRPGVKFGTFLNISEAKRVASQFIGQKDKNGNDLDPKGNASISELLYIVANLAENSEVDPYLKSIDERIEYFKDIDMQTALDLLFFLINIEMNSSENQDLLTSLIPQALSRKTSTKVTHWQKLKQTLKKYGSELVGMFTSKTQ